MRQILAALVCSALLITALGTAALADPLTDALVTADPALETATDTVSTTSDQAHQTPVQEAAGGGPSLVLLQDDQVSPLVGAAVGDEEINVPNEGDLVQLNLGAARVACTIFAHRPTYVRRFRHVQGKGELKCSANVTGTLRVYLQRHRWYGWENLAGVKNFGTRSYFVGRANHTCTRGQTFTYRTVVAFDYRTAAGVGTLGPYTSEPNLFTC